MPIVRQYDAERKIVYVLWYGRITASDWLKNIAHVMPTLNLLEARTWIIDQRKAVMDQSLSASTISEAVGLYKQYEYALQKSRIAIVAHGFYPVARFLEKLMAESNIKIIVFTNFDVACSFLGLNDSETGRILDVMNTRSTIYAPEQDV